MAHGWLDRRNKHPRNSRLRLAGLGMALAGAIAFGAPSARAAVYDVNADFSTASNPNGVWTYGFETTLGGPLTLYDQPNATDCGSGAWRSLTVQSLQAPVDCSNKTNSQVGLVPAHTAAFHPGPSGEFSVFRFTTPAAGSYDLAAVFSAIDNGGTDVHILDNGTSLFSHEIDPANTPESFSATLLLVAGELIDFAVGVGTDGNFFSDSTGINASLTTSAVSVSVPEPSSILLILSAAFAALAIMRRRSPVARRGV